MSERIHIILERAEKERFRRLARREGKSLSQWLRDAAHAKLAEAQAERSLQTPESLREFFAECSRREQGIEPDWEVHREVIEGSITAGGSRT